MKISISLLIVVSIFSATKAADTANCIAGSNENMYCARCNETNCTLCVGGYTDEGKCKAPDSLKSNCLRYFSAGCTLCNDGFYVDVDSACQPNPVSGQDYVENCAQYKYISQVTAVKCIGCNGIKGPDAGE